MQVIPAHVIRAEAGCGKTEAAIQEITKCEHTVEVYVPTHKLAEEFEKRLHQHAPNKGVAIVRGRSAANHDGESMCKKHALAEELSRAGQSVYPNLCTRKQKNATATIRCEHFEGCAYLKQFYPTDVTIYTHTYLGLERGVYENPPPAIAIIDESFWQHCIRLQTFNLSVLFHHDIPSAAQTLCRRIARAMQEQHWQEMRAAMIDARDSGELFRAISSLGKRSSFVSPDMPVAEIRDRLKQLLPLNLICALLCQLDAETCYNRPLQSVTYNADSGEVTVYQRLALTRFMGMGLHRAVSPPTVILALDASADQTILKQFADIKRIEQIKMRRNAYVKQCHSTRCSNTRLMPDKNRDKKSSEAAEQALCDVARCIDHVRSLHEKVLVVGPSGVIGNARTGTKGALKLRADVDYAHFNSLRGLDKYKNHDSIVVIGRNQPPIDAVEGYARALYYDDPEPLQVYADFADQIRGYTMPDARFGVSVQVHPDPRGQAIMEQLRERETEQAIDRLRLVHHDGAPKHVYVLSNLPLDISVDELADWKSLVSGGDKLERAIRQNDGVVLPLEPGWLSSTRPDLWPTKEAAKKDIGRKKGHIPNSISLRNMSLFEFMYKQKRQRRWSRCLSRIDDVQAVQSALEGLLATQVAVKALPQG